MKRIMKLKYSLLGLWSIFMLQACELESEVYDSINPSIFPKTEQDVDAIITANVYGAFRSEGYGGIFSTAGGIGVINDAISDYGICSWDWGFASFAQWTAANGDTWPLRDFWQWGSWISKMTMSLDRIKNVPIDEQALKKYTAELRMGRGWMAYLLYDYYGPIVIADLETLKSPLANKILPRLSEEEMQTYIETELTEAAKDLPYNYKKGDNDYGRFTKGLANTVLLKFYMLTKQFDKAETIGRELMKPEYGYSLVPQYADIFTLANEKNSEIVWAVQCKTGFQMQIWQPHILPSDYDFTPLLDGLAKWNGFKIMWSYINSYDPADKRLGTMITEYTSKSGVLHNQTIDSKKPGEQLYLGAVPLKYEIDPATLGGEQSQIDWIIYRYADVLTLTAEAITRNKGVTDEAVNMLNRVRERALPGKGYKSSDFSNKEALLKAILDERGWELYYEGCRRQDLIRYGLYVQAIKDKSASKGALTNINEHYVRIPIPQGYIDQGRGIVKQNEY